MWTCGEMMFSVGLKIIISKEIEVINGIITECQRLLYDWDLNYYDNHRDFKKSYARQSTFSDDTNIFPINRKVNKKSYQEINLNSHREVSHLRRFSAKCKHDLGEFPRDEYAYTKSLRNCKGRNKLG